MEISISMVQYSRSGDRGAMVPVRLGPSARDEKDSDLGLFCIERGCQSPGPSGIGLLRHSTNQSEGHIHCTIQSSRLIVPADEICPRLLDVQFDPVKFNEIRQQKCMKKKVS
jgi:hypothetical protein